MYALSVLDLCFIPTRPLPPFQHTTAKKMRHRNKQYQVH